jgi:hypothetical protein
MHKGKEGYQGVYTTAKDTVRALKQQLREVNVPLTERRGYTPATVSCLLDTL